MALNNLEDIKIIDFEIPFQTNCSEFKEFTKYINKIQVETQSKIILQQIVRINIVGNGDGVANARRRIDQLNANWGQIKKQIEELERKKVELERKKGELEMVNKLQFKTNAVTNKIVEMLANNIKVEENTQEENVISDEELQNFCKSEECVDFIKEFGRQPLHAASRFGRLDVVKKMIRKGMDVNIKDDNNMTPLMFASFKNQKEIVEFLISKNADLNIRSKSNKTALSRARSQENKEIIEILIKYGATD